MAHYLTTLDIARSASDTFAFISDFRHAPRWDPQTLQAHKVSDGPIGLGTRYLLIGEFMWRKLILPYEIVGYRPPGDGAPGELVLVGETSTISYCDRIEFAEAGADRTRLTYDAQLDFKGIFRVGELALRQVFQYIGDKATRGMPQAVANGVP